MNPYEMTFIVRPDRDEDGTRAVVETVTGRITAAGGELIAAIPWNPPRRRMAYPIKDFGDGFYVTTVFRIESSALGPIETALKLNENILRFLIVQATDLNIKQAQQRLQQQQQAAAAPPPPQPPAVGAPSEGAAQETAPAPAGPSEPASSQEPASAQEPAGSPEPVGSPAPVGPPETVVEPIVGTEPADAASDLAQPATAEAISTGPIGAEPEE